MIKRLLDILFSLFGLVLLSPIFLVVSMLIIIESKGGAFYSQLRVGKNNKDFRLFKFRTMFGGSDNKGLITIGENDVRITKIGYSLRKYKIDELPQLLNILFGQMSLIGPRPEVRKYVSLYTEQQLKVLSVRPGLTDYASIKFVNENEILSQYKDPEEAYIKTIMPEKLKLNLQYIEEQSILTDLKIVLETIHRILFK